MTLRKPSTIFGVQSICIYNPTTGRPYGVSKWLEQSNLEIGGETVKLMSGAYKQPIDAFTPDRNSTVSIVFSHFESWMCKPLLGTDAEILAQNSNVIIDDKENIQGTSLSGLTIGGSSTNSANAKFSKYIAIATGTDSINIYGLSDVDFNRGQAIDYQDDSLKLLANDITVTQTATEIASLGITVLKGSDDFVADDSASFFVRPALDSGAISRISDIASVPNVGLFITAEKLNGNRLVAWEFPRVVCEGLTLNSPRQDFTKPELSFAVLAQQSGAGYRIHQLEAV